VLARFCSSTKMISFRTGLISGAMVAAAAPLEFACVTSLIVHSLISITPTMNDTDAHCSGINLASLHDRISEIEDDGLRLSFVY
jgi:hypothetical protein